MTLAVARVERDNQVPSITRIARPRPSASAKIAVGNLVARRMGRRVDVSLIFVNVVVNIYVCVGLCDRVRAMRSHGSLLPCGALEWVASSRPGHSMLCTLRAQGHSFSDSHRLRRAWQKDALTARAHSQGTTPCSAVCLQTAEPVGAVPRLGKRPKTLIVLLTSLHYQSLLLSS